jgi:hypothetical protein
MKHINKSAAKVMFKLIEGISENNSYKKIDNSTTIFMPVVVERLGKNTMGDVYSVCHYYEQNGDLMRDPDMVFWHGTDGNFYPVSFQQDNLGIYEQSVWLDGQKYMIRQKQQSDHAVFANIWMKNIKYQQGL